MSENKRDCLRICSVFFLVILVLNLLFYFYVLKPVSFILFISDDVQSQVIINSLIEEIKSANGEDVSVRIEYGQGYSYSVASIGSNIRIFMNTSNLSAEEKRAFYAHELGHGLESHLENYVLLDLLRRYNDPKNRKELSIWEEELEYQRLIGLEIDADRRALRFESVKPEPLISLINKEVPDNRQREKDLRIHAIRMYLSEVGDSK